MPRRLSEIFTRRPKWLKFGKKSVGKGEPQPDPELRNDIAEDETITSSVQFDSEILQSAKANRRDAGRSGSKHLRQSQLNKQVPNDTRVFEQARLSTNDVELQIPRKQRLSGVPQSSGFVDAHEPPTISTQNRSDSYQYDPLWRDWIRLLVLSPLPQHSTGVIQCQMKYVSLHSPRRMPYEAISYVWGDPTPKSFVIVDGCKFYLPENGEKALRRMALPDQDRTVWIDSVCINQADTLERAQQVTMMASIFRDATAVLVYLGEADAYTERAVSDMKLLETEIDQDIGAGLDITDADVFKGHIAYLTPVRTEFDAEALVMLFSRTWFRRVWVIQEVAVAARSYATCGTYDFDMHVALRIAYWLRDWHALSISMKLYSTLNTVYRIWTMRADYMQSSGSLISEALRVSRNCEASDPRDKIFSMLGLLRENVLHQSLMPSYEKPIAHVFRDATRRDFMTGTPPYFLWTYLAHKDQNDLMHSGVPSWVPRFDLQRSKDGEIRALVMHGPNKWSGDYKLAWKATRDFNDSNILTVRGFTLGTIKSTLGTVDPYSTTYLPTLRQMKSKLATRGLPSDALTRTLMADTNFSFQRSSAEDYASFEILSACISKGVDVPSTRQMSKQTSSEIRRAGECRKSVDVVCHKRVVAVLDDGTIGLVPRLSRVGDKVVVIHGGGYPIILRPRGEGYLLLGFSYIDGYMIWQDHGNELEQRLMEDENETFNIV